MLKVEIAVPIMPAHVSAATPPGKDKLEYKPSSSSTDVPKFDGPAQKTKVKDPVTFKLKAVQEKRRLELELGEASKDNSLEALEKGRRKK